MKPIVFSGPMIGAILEGRKTQTRRVIKEMPQNEEAVALITCPYTVGMKLWVREIWKEHIPTISGTEKWAHYRAESDGLHGLCCSDTVWHSPRFMPRWASRITLEVLNVRVERLQDITEEDAKAEGSEQYYSDNLLFTCYRGGFKFLWKSINAKRGVGWGENPFVWVVEFKKI